VLKGDEYNEDRTFSNHKISRIKDYIGERDKVAVACRYNDQLEYIEDKIDPDKDVYKIWGGDSNREETISDIQDADKCVVLVNAAVSEGYEFPSISLMVFASLSFSYVDYRQMKGRLLRMDDPSKNVYVHLVTQRDGDDNETVDEAVYDNVVNKKQKFDVEIYAQEKGEFSEV
jgi:superfamily II DNA or RNA helicase